MNALFTFPRNLADWIVLEVGLELYRRVSGLPPRRLLGLPEERIEKGCFVEDLLSQCGGDAVVDFLREELTPARVEMIIMDHPLATDEMREGLGWKGGGT